MPARSLRPRREALESSVKAELTIGLHRLVRTLVAGDVPRLFGPERRAIASHREVALVLSKQYTR